MNDRAPFDCREDLPLPVRLTAALVVLLLLLPYHPLTWIATAQAGAHAGYCHMSEGPCTCSHHAPTNAPASEHTAAHVEGTHGAQPAHEHADPEATTPPCHADEADEQALTLLEGTGITPPPTHLCGCGHDGDDLTSAVAIDRFVRHGISGVGGPPVPDAPTAVITAVHLQPIAVDIFRPPPPVR